MGKYLKWYHLAMMVLWVGLVLPGVTVWKESIVFVILLSLYANFETSFSAWHASRAEQKADDNGSD